MNEAQAKVKLADKELEEARARMEALVSAGTTATPESTGATEGSEERRLLELEYNAKLATSQAAHAELDTASLSLGMCGRVAFTDKVSEHGYV